MRSVSRSRSFRGYFGKPPGNYESLISKDEDDFSYHLRFHRYDVESFDVTDIDDVPSLRQCIERSGVKWLEVQGTRNVGVMKDLGELFGIHPLIIEDIMNPDVKPKMEMHGDFIFIAAKIPHIDDDALKMDHFSLLLFKDKVISFHDSLDSPFDYIRQRMSMKESRMRGLGPDYLAYVILDNVVDHFILSVKILEDGMDDLEQNDLAEYDSTLFVIDGLRKKSLGLRRDAVPLQRLSMELKGYDSPLISDEMDIFLSDLNDHTGYVVESLDNIRETLMGMQQLNLAITSNRMNDVMKVLTIVATIFIPLTFVAGIYGMNFRNMPELGWEWGYYMVLVVMAVIGICMTAYFRRRKWI